MSDEKKGLMTSIYNDGGSPAVKQIGYIMEGTIKFIALPFKFLGMTADQLEARYKTFIEDALKKIPPEKINMPRGSIAAPLLEQVKYCFADNKEDYNSILYEKYLNLLASAMNEDYRHIILPSFVEKLKCCSGYDAMLLDWFNDNPAGAYATEFDILDEPNNNELIIATSPCNVDFPLNFPIATSLESLESLGLINIFQREYLGGINYLEDVLKFWRMQTDWDTEIKKYENTSNLDLNILYEHIQALKIPKNILETALEAENLGLEAISPNRGNHSLLFEVYFLQEELERLDGLLTRAKNENKLPKDYKLWDMICVRYNAGLTRYGRDFMRCCKNCK